MEKKPENKVNMSPKLTFLQYRVTSNPTAATAMGFTKNHVLIEVFAVGDWRSICYCTPRQAARMSWQKMAIGRLLVNGGITEEESNNIMFSKVN